MSRYSQGRGSTRWRRDSPDPSRPTLKSTKCPAKWVRGIFLGVKGGEEGVALITHSFKLRGLAGLARNGKATATGNARSVEKELKHYQTILNGWPTESGWNEKSQLQVLLTITALHKMAVTADNFVHRAACGRNFLSLLRLKAYVKSNTTERPSDPCLTSLEKEPVKRLNSEKAVDKFESENQNRILLNK